MVKGFIAAGTVAALVLLALDAPADRLGLPVPPATTSRHFITNLDDSVRPKRLGFNIFDTSATRSDVHGLPRGVKALVWLGQKCPTVADRPFRRTVRRLADLKRVFGYYLSDEPHVADCPGGPLALRSRADFIDKVTDGRQVTFIVLNDDADYRAFRPRVTHVDLFGLDPYPCSVANPSCDLSKIDEDVGTAIDAGIRKAEIVPVFQAFGQELTDDPYYTLPTARQLRDILRRWAELVPHPVFDYTYSWGNQGSADPTLVDAPELQELFTTYFAD
jgi:hypothetical protein